MKHYLKRQYSSMYSAIQPWGDRVEATMERLKNGKDVEDTVQAVIVMHQDVLLGVNTMLDLEGGGVAVTGVSISRINLFFHNWYVVELNKYY